MERYGKIKETKYQRRYEVPHKTLPRIKEEILIPINIEMLDEPLNETGWFTIKWSKNKKTKMTIIMFKLTENEYKKCKDWEAEVTTPDGYNPELILVNPKNDWQVITKGDRVHGLPKNMKDCVGFWVVRDDDDSKEN